MFSKLAYAMIKLMGNKVMYLSKYLSYTSETFYEYSCFINLFYHKKWVIKLCISVNIYHRLPKPGMSTHVFKISLCYVKKFEIKLCISVKIYPRLPKLGMSSHDFNIILCYDKPFK